MTAKLPSSKRVERWPMRGLMRDPEYSQTVASLRNIDLSGRLREERRSRTTTFSLADSGGIYPHECSKVYAGLGSVSAGVAFGRVVYPSTDGRAGQYSRRRRFSFHHRRWEYLLLLVYPRGNGASPATTHRRSHRDLVGAPDRPSWTEPERILLSNDLALDGAPFVQGDTLWFGSIRSGNYGEIDCYTAIRQSNAWGNILNAGSQLNQVYDVGELHITADGHTLYYGKLNGSTYDLYTLTKSGNTWSAPLPVPNVNTALTEFQPFVTADGSELSVHRRQPLWLPRPGDLPIFLE